MINMNKLLQAIKSKIMKMNIGKELLLIDLIKEGKWIKIPKDQQIFIGLFILNYMKNESKSMLIYLKKLLVNQRYIRGYIYEK